MRERNDAGKNRSPRLGLHDSTATCGMAPLRSELTVTHLVFLTLLDASYQRFELISR